MKKILIQTDTDPQPSSFDRVVAIDAGVDQLFSYGGVTAAGITQIVHGAVFTRGPADLKNSAVFIGGSKVAEGETLMKKVRETFFGPMRVSVMMDSNGCNTTAAAAVAVARQHLPLVSTSALVLGGTGPVGQRVAQLLLSEGCAVTLVSRSQERADQVCTAVRQYTDNGQLQGAGADSEADIYTLCSEHQLVVAAGAAGVQFLKKDSLAQLSNVKVAIDLNAVPPTGLEDIAVTDKGTEHGGTICFGAIGIGGTKMKVHKQAVAALFEANDRVFDTQDIYSLALKVTGQA